MEDVQLLSSLPDDPHKLREIILQLSQRKQQRTRERDEVAGERDDWQVKFLRAEVELLRLKKWYYGPRADMLQTCGDVAQLLMNLPGTPMNKLAQWLPDQWRQRNLSASA